ncbi:putative quinol monooxygenase [uncultured Paracoccus sp.]|uniref:putative quinol monooxygenase n=1 Tax=uncultured Paracoccus sp. TaxID=189685 RepID=UPI00260B7CC3|nr:putative quinol monooxygenase [uncultured Paracoccus sp.]
MVVVIGTLLLRPGAATQIEDALKILMPRACKDDGRLSHDLSGDIKNWDLTRFAERWRDRASVEAHNAQPYRAAFQADAQPYLAEAPEIAIYEVSAN